MNARCSNILLAVAIPLLAGAAARADCPVSIAQLELDAPFPIEQAVFDSADVSTHLTFDRSLCRTSLTSVSSGRADVYVRVVEAFDLAGVAPGTIVPVTVTFDLSGSVYQSCGASGCGAELSATLRSGPDSVTAAALIAGPTPPTTKPLVQTLSLPVTITAGTPVVMQFVLRYGTGPGQEEANGTVTGRWSVIGLPAGASAVSCLGTTPVRARSWGALKVRYR
jgi:hypothetical protein